jgi:acyl-CoA hydrolase
MSWQIDYKKKLRTPDEALRCVSSGMRVYIQPGCAEPETLVEALMKRGPYVEDVEIVHMMTMGTAPYVAREMEGHFRHNAVFIGANVRDAINDGRADYTPIYLSEIEELFTSGAMPLDVALVQVSPPDLHGFCSFGVGVDTTLTAAHQARFVVAQVNDQMPRTYGDSYIHVNDVDVVVESSRPLCAMKKHAVTDLHTAIASNVASLIEDGSVLQTGIGGIPDAVLPLLIDRKDLGVHSELVSDGVIPLIEAGVITGERKNFKPRKVIVGFVLGSKRIFDFVDNNPIFEFHPTCYVNDPGLIDGTISRITPMLSPGAGVVTSRGLVRYVVTEFGVAYLHGKSIRERAKALIEIAHPKFREELYTYCEQTKWLQRPEPVATTR